MFQAIRSRVLVLASLLLSLGVLAPTLSATDDFDGFLRADISRPTEPHVSLASGDFLAFDGVDVVRYDATLVPTLVASIDPEMAYPFVFPSFITVSDDGSRAFVGRTACDGAFQDCSFGDLWSIELASGVTTFQGLLSGNFDGAFADADNVYVTAKPCGFSCSEASVFHSAVGFAGSTEVVRVAGASGPIAFDSAGNMYLGTVSDLFPPPANSSSLLLFDAASLSSATLLTEQEGTLLAGGLEGASSLAIDRPHGDVLLAANRYAVNGAGADATVNLVYAIQGGHTTTLFTGELGKTLSNLEVATGNGTARIFPYQPSTGGTFLVRASDFTLGTSSFREYAPARPELATSAAGTTATLDVTSAGSGNAVLFYYGPASATLGTEQALALPGVSHAPFFLGLDTNLIVFDPVPVLTDANGAATRSYQIPAGVPAGTYSAQGLSISLGAKPLGTTNVSVL